MRANRSSLRNSNLRAMTFRRIFSRRAFAWSRTWDCNGCSERPTDPVRTINTTHTCRKLLPWTLRTVAASSAPRFAFCLLMSVLRVSMLRLQASRSSSTLLLISIRSALSSSAALFCNVLSLSSARLSFPESAMTLLMANVAAFFLTACGH